MDTLTSIKIKTSIQLKKLNYRQSQTISDYLGKIVKV